MQSEFQLQVINTPDDFHRFQRFYCKPRAANGKQAAVAWAYLLLLGAIILPLETVLMVLFERFVFDLPKSVERVWLYVVGGGLLLFTYFMTINALLRRVSKPDLGNFTTPATISISTEGIRTTSEIGEGLIRWRGIRDVVPSNEAIYLGTGGGTALVIPTRFFKSPAEASAFVVFAREQTSAQAVSQPTAT